MSSWKHYGKEEVSAVISKSTEAINNWMTEKLEVRQIVWHGNCRTIDAVLCLSDLTAMRVRDTERWREIEQEGEFKRADTEPVGVGVF